MRKLTRSLAVLLGTVVLVAVIVLGWAWLKTERGLARTYLVRDPPLALPRDAQTVAKLRGARSRDAPSTSSAVSWETRLLPVSSP
mgnify:CR=1 FL=1